MTWPQVAVLAGAIVLGFLLHGGVYTVGNPGGGAVVTRMNRLTGQVEVWNSTQNYWRTLGAQREGGAR